MTEGIIGAIIGSAITGIIAFLCEIIKIKHQDKKERAKEQKEIFINRPELKILDYVNNIDEPGASINKKCDIDVFIVPIDDVSIEDGYLDVKYNLDYFYHFFLLYLIILFHLFFHLHLIFLLDYP